jgi:hypothetical protein
MTDEQQPAEKHPAEQHPEDTAELRAEVERLKAQLEPGATGRAGWWRPVLATVLIVLAALLAPLAVVASWADDQVGDTDRYVDTVGPLAENPAVQEAIVARLTTVIYDQLRIEAITKEAVDALAARGLPPNVAASLEALSGPLASGVRNFVETRIRDFVRSEEFAAAWDAANREAHEQLVLLLTGEGDGAIEVQGNKVSVQLATIIETVKARLEDRGFALASRIPDVNAEFTIIQSADIQGAQTAFRLLGAAATFLPILALVLFGIAIAISRSRRRAIIGGCVGVAFAMLMLGLSINFFRILYLDSIPADMNEAAAAATYDQVVTFLRTALRAVLVLFLALAVVAWLSGKEAAPAAVRRGFGKGIDSVRHRSDQAGLETGPVGAFAWTYRVPIRWGLLGLAILIYVMAAHPTGAFTLTLVIVTALVLLVIELVARRPAEPAEPA